MDKYICLLLAVCLFLLSGCQAAQTGSLPEEETYDPLPLETFMGNSGRVTEDENYYYILTNGHMHLIDKTTWQVEKACWDPLCSHDGSCLYSGWVSEIVNVQGEILVVFSPFSSYYDVNTIYRINTEDMVAQAYLSLDNRVSGLSVLDGVSAAYHWIDDVENKSGYGLLTVKGKQTEPMSGDILQMYMDEDWYYFLGQGMNFYRINRITLQQIPLVSYIAGRFVIEGDRIYYPLYDAKKRQTDLYVMKKDGTGKERLLEKVYSFEVYEDQIFYLKQQSQAESMEMYRYDCLTGENDLIAERVDSGFDVLPGAKRLVIHRGDEYSTIRFDGSDLQALMEDSF